MGAIVIRSRISRGIRDNSGGSLALEEKKPSSCRIWRPALVVVCEYHFLERDFVDSTSYTDSMTGKVIEVPLKLRRLKPSAIPSVFPNCPAHLSRQETSARESPEEKRARVDAEALQEAIRLSEQSHEAGEKKNVIAIFEDLLTAVGDLSLTDF
ncbi:hypothetical protein HPB51_005552 [Rhipicephalus microplus]|uniref:THAP-type domain-containing protein n=1 Tax=Rhipicephalus microplus TaxID=6941 RepID=A0A9J6EY21_RHIMP|nr:hypothetical protein HPB51_005552 [Rhipicephalus microplus]